MWPPAGKTTMEVVHEEALDILHNHQPLPLPEGAADKIEAIVAEADEALVWMLEALSRYATLACSAKARCLRWTRVWAAHLL